MLVPRAPGAGVLGARMSGLGPLGRAQRWAVRCPRRLVAGCWERLWTRRLARGPVRAGSGGSAWRLPECGAGWSGQPSPREPLEGWVELRWDALSLAVACVGCALLARAHMQPHLGLQGRVCLRHAVGVLVVSGCAPRRFPDRFSCRCFVPGRCWVRGVSQTF